MSEVTPKEALVHIEIELEYCSPNKRNEQALAVLRAFVEQRVGDGPYEQMWMSLGKLLWEERDAYALKEDGHSCAYVAGLDFVLERINKIARRTKSTKSRKPTVEEVKGKIHQYYASFLPEDPSTQLLDELLDFIDQKGE